MEFSKREFKQGKKRECSPGAHDDIQRFYKKLRQVKGEGVAINQEIHDIDKQIARLTTQRENCLAKSYVIQIGTLSEAANDYSGSWTSQFLLKMRSRLPRELRDMILERFWLDTTKEFRTVVKILARMAHGPHQRPCVCLRSVDVPHIVNPAYVGLEMAYEAVEALYRTFPPQFEHAAHLDEVHALLNGDIFHIGFKPAAVLRRLHLSCRLDQNIEIDENRKPRLFAESLHKQFRALLDVVDKRDFELRVIFKQRNIFLGMLDEALGVFSPVYDQFKQQGANVIVAYTYCGSKYDEDEHDIIGRLDGYFDHCDKTGKGGKAGKKDWKKEAMETLEDHPCIQARHRKYRYEGTGKQDPWDYLLERGMMLDNCEPTDDEDSDTETDSEYGYGYGHDMYSDESEVDSISDWLGP